MHEIVLEHTANRNEYFDSDIGQAQIPAEEVYRIVKCKNCSTVSGQSEYLIDGET